MNREQQLLAKQSTTFSLVRRRFVVVEYIAGRNVARRGKVTINSPYSRARNSLNFGKVAIKESFRG